jgi:AcrR family transcriptional regulator
LGAGSPEQVHPARERILRAAVEVLAEHGLPRATVRLVIERAHVSRSTFQRTFGGLEACVQEVLERAGQHAIPLVSDALQTDGSWQDKIRATLVAALCFLDTEPALARVALVDALAGGPAVLASRERAVESLRRPIVGQIEREVPYAWPCAGDAMFMFALAMMQDRLTARQTTPLIGLLAPLMASVIAPYSDLRAIAEECARSQRLASRILRERELAARAAAEHAGWTGTALPAMLASRRSRRSRECLEFVAAHPLCSNAEVAAGIGVKQASQISSLLASLESEQLLAKRSRGAGKRNEWRVTRAGKDAVRALAGEPAATP